MDITSKIDDLCSQAKTIGNEELDRHSVEKKHSKDLKPI